MDIISYATGAKAQKTADSKVQRFISDVASIPDVSLLSNGDEWLNTDNGKEMIVLDGVFVESLKVPGILATGDSVLYVDTVTGDKYKIVVTNGVLVPTIV